MASLAPTAVDPVTRRASGPTLDHPVHPLGRWLFMAVLVAGLGYAGISIAIDTAHVGESIAVGAFVFLGLALLIALASNS